MNSVIYIRTSTIDQNPQNQLDDCLAFAKNKGYEVLGVHEEKLSGYKQIIRPEYDNIKELARTGKIQAVIVWALDRWVRNRDTLLEDVAILRTYGCKLHSIKEGWLEAINLDGALGRTIQEFLLGLIGSIAEMESQRKSERVKIAYQNHSGAKWGRKSLPKSVIDEVLKYHSMGVSMRQISKQVSYTDKNNHPKHISLASVHKIITQNQAKS